MPIIKRVRGKLPQFGQRCYLADNATVVGDVQMGNDCSIWFQAVVRGDVNGIVLGDRVNVQDGAIIHCTYEKAATKIGSDVSIGHRAIVHGCTIYDHVLVGMGAIVMDNAIVESNVLIAAGSVVLENTRLESGYLYAGVPAKKIKPLSEDLLKGQIERIAGNYIKYASWFKT